MDSPLPPRIAQGMPPTPATFTFIPHAAYDETRDCLTVRLQEDGYDEEECSSSAVIFRDRSDGRIVGYRVEGVSQVFEGPGPHKAGRYLSGNVVRALARRTANGLSDLFAEYAELMERILDGQHLFEVPSH